MASTQKKRGPSPREREDAATWLHGQLAKGERPAGDILTRRSLGSATAAQPSGEHSTNWNVSGGKTGSAMAGFGRSQEDATEGVTEPLGARNLTPSHLRENTEDNNTEHTKKYSSCVKVSGCESVAPSDEYAYQFPGSPSRQPEYICDLEQFEAERLECNGDDGVPFS